MRPFDPAADAGRLAGLLTVIGPDPVSEADVHAWMAGENAETVSESVIAPDGSAYADVYRQPWHPAGEFTGRVVVAPHLRRRGTGARLLDHINRFAAGNGGSLLTGRVREDDPDSLRFAEHQGFS